MTTVRTARPDDPAGSGGEFQPGAEPEPGGPRTPADARGRAASRFAHSLVWEQARARPHQVALRADGERDRTYADLHHASARLAARLVEAGVGPDDTVAVLMERSADVVVAMLAILDAGGAYAAVDLAHPPARLACVLRDLRPRAVVADRGLPVPDAAGGAPVLHVAEADGGVAGDDGAGPRRPRRAPLREDNLAYVLHTSGSTGVPKGVAMTHRGLNRLLAWQLEDGERGLTTLQFTSFCFDVTFQEVLSTLGGGGTLYLPSEPRRQDPDQLLLAMREHRVARLFLPNVALRQVVTAARRSGVVPDGLRHVVTAGERLTITGAVARFFDALGGARLDNHYGPTETHLVTSHRLTGPAADWPAFPPIGTPVDEVTVHLLDDELAPVRAGEVGQLYVGGVGLARGYLRAPGATADRFRPDPFAVAPGARLYRTGDLARADETGLLHFLGRDDGQLKVRGFRVEPADVEIVLTEHPGIRDAAVSLRSVAGDTGDTGDTGGIGDEARGDGAGGGETVRVLVAFVVPEGAAELSAAELRPAKLLIHVRDRLPDYMVPSRFVFVDHLPVTSTGKLDRSGLASLPLPVVEPPPAEDGTAGAEPTAAAVRAIWERVLGHGEFADDEDFFDVGGDSLLAVWAVRELADRFGRDIDLSIFLRDSTVAAVTAALGAAAPSAAAVRGGGRRGWSEAVTLRSGPSTRVLFLAPPLGGELLAYRELAAALRSPVRVVGLRWRAPGHLDHSLAELARVHLEQVRAVQPVGPYLLAGWSFGGVVAYEMAQQLLQAGERVDFLGLLDANPVRDPLTGMTTAESPHLAVLDQALASMTGPGETAGPARAAGPVDSTSWRGLLGGGLPDGMTVSHLGDTLAAARASTRAAMSYHARPYPGAVHLFQAAASSEVIRDALRADLDALVTGTARVTTVPGDHRGMLRAPDVAVLAEAIDTTLRGA